MNNKIIIALKRKLDAGTAFGAIGVETQRNVLKEELQFYVLNFIYHHAKYSDWVMYGGSALRICHGLNRMSVDLDFEVTHLVTEDFLGELKKEIETYFTDTYSTDSDFLTIKTTSRRGLLLRFYIGDKLGIEHPSKQVYVKIDLNNFTAPNTVTERQTINTDQFSFVIKTYNMSALMASKIAAIFLRGPRGVGKKIYEEKGRDIYDLLWYMNKKTIPDLDYLVAKGIDVSDLRTLFDKLTLQMNKVSDANLKQDLTPLFLDTTFIENWLKNWRESYFRLFEEYKIHTVTTLEKVSVDHDFHTDIFYFVYLYKTEDGKFVKITYNISDDWIDLKDGDLSTEASEKIKKLFDFDSDKFSWNPISREKLMQYAELFYQKTEDYFKRTNRVMLGFIITTKLIRTTADGFNQKEEILLNKSALMSAKLDDLFK